ncbi:Nose resistant to fluoxetine protein 6-like protein, partial [Leptotrombidium deliense]
MAWIILGHTAIWVHFQTFSKQNCALSIYCFAYLGQSFRIIDVITPLYTQAILNATLSVETFFVLSGLLTSYVTWGTTHGEYRNFSSFWYLMSRYVRLTPGLIAAIGGTLFLPHLGSGPLWHEIIDPIVNGCKENWWVDLLYLQNYVNSEKIVGPLFARNIVYLNFHFQCLLPSWWLSVDMHFHIISLVIVIALMRRPTVGLIANTLTIIAFTVIGGIVHYLNGYPAAIVPTQPQIEEYWLDFVLNYFYKPWVHAGPFFIGLILGYFLAKRQFLKLSKRKAIICWIVASVLLITSLHTSYYWNLGNTSSKFVAALHDSTNRIFWSLGIAWVIYACSSGYGGLINRFLSCSAFVPLARLTFMVYLTHMWLVWCYMATRRDLLHTSTYTI